MLFSIQLRLSFAVGLLVVIAICCCRPASSASTDDSKHPPEHWRNLEKGISNRLIKENPKEPTAGYVKLNALLSQTAGDQFDIDKYAEAAKNSEFMLENEKDEELGYALENFIELTKLDTTDMSICTEHARKIINENMFLAFGKYTLDNTKLDELNPVEQFVHFMLKTRVEYCHLVYIQILGLKLQEPPMEHIWDAVNLVFDNPLLGALIRGSPDTVATLFLSQTVKSDDIDSALAKLAENLKPSLINVASRNKIRIFSEKGKLDQSTLKKAIATYVNTPCDEFIGSFKDVYEQFHYDILHNFENMISHEFEDKDRDIMLGSYRFNLCSTILAHQKKFVEKVVEKFRNK